MSARVPDGLVMQMHADYVAGLSLAAVGRKYARDRRGVRELFESRGLAVRPLKYAPPPRLANGRIAAAPKLTPAQIDALVEGATKVAVPVALKREWRQWPLIKRAWFILRLRLKLMLPTERPWLPFSANVTPFDYGTPAAWEICRRMNAGRNSRTARIKIDVCTQGVIWRGQLWFWCHKVGYQRGPWTPEGGRPSLHHVIWEEANGRKVLAHHVLAFLDGNDNNLVSENLALKHRGDLAVENKAAGVLKRERHDRFFKMNAAAAALTRV